MSKREIYEKLINNRSEREIWEGYLRETDQQVATKDQGYREKMQQLRGRSKKEDFVCIKKKTWYKEGDMEWICKDNKLFYLVHKSGGN